MLPDDDPYWTLQPRRAVVALGLGFVAVAVLAVVAKTVIETATSLVYTIHWLETVPILSAVFAWVIHGEWNRRVPPQQADDASQAPDDAS